MNEIWGTKLTSTIAPAASDKVGEMSSKSNLKKHSTRKEKTMNVKWQLKLHSPKISREENTASYWIPTVRANPNNSTGRIWKREGIQAKLAMRFLLNKGSWREVIFNVGSIKIQLRTWRLECPRAIHHCRTITSSSDFSKWKVRLKGTLDPENWPIFHFSSAVTEKIFDSIESLINSEISVKIFYIIRKLHPQRYPIK